MNGLATSKDEWTRHAKGCRITQQTRVVNTRGEECITWPYRGAGLEQRVFARPHVLAAEQGRRVVAHHFLS